MTEAPGKLTLWGIEVFLATAEEGAVSSAARRLGVSPSAISQQISGLEAALGVALLDRSARPVRMTPAGAMFRRHAQTIVNAASEARAELAVADLSGLTTLRIGVIEDLDANVTPRLLAEMAQDWRGCRFLLETGASHWLLDQLDARALDMVVAADMGAVQKVESDWMEIHPLLTEPFVMAAPKGAIDPKRDVAAQAQALPLILYTARHHMGRQIAGHLARLNLRLSHRFELDSYHAIMAMVASGAGWTILTPLGIQAAQRFQGQIDVLPLPFAPLDRTISLFARQGVLRDMPGQVAIRLRGLLQTQVVDPTITAMPWTASSPACGLAHHIDGRIDQGGGNEIQLGLGQPRWQPHVAGPHQHGAGQRQFRCIPQKLPVPEGARVIVAQAEDLHRNAARFGRRLIGAGLCIGFETHQIELDGIRRAHLGCKRFRHLQPISIAFSRAAT